MNGAGQPSGQQPRVWRDRRWWARVVCAAIVGVWLASAAIPARAQLASLVVEQVLAPGAGGLVSAPLDPARRYSLLVLSVPEGAGFHGSFSQNWFARDGARRAGSNEGPLAGRAPWDQELLPPAPALAQWTYAASIWNDGSGSMIVRILDHGPR